MDSRAHQNRGHSEKESAPIPVVAAAMPKNVKQAFSKVMGNQAGRLALRWIMQYCGYKTSPLTMKPNGELLFDAIVHNAAKHAVWIDLRNELKQISVDNLNKIEMESVNDVNKEKPTKQKVVKKSSK